jgi:hypothetical protein
VQISRADFSDPRLEAFLQAHLDDMEPTAPPEKRMIWSDMETPITGSAAPGPMLPRPRTAEPSVTTATELPLMVSLRTSSGLSWIAIDTRPTPGV